MSQRKYNKKESDLQVILKTLVQPANEVSQFSQRNRELNAEGFVQTLVLGWLRQPTASLNDLAQTADELGITVTGAALHERLNVKAVMLLEQVLAGALQQVGAYRRLQLSGLERFRAILVTDSTQVDLPKSLLTEFRGSNGDAKVKLQVTLDYLTGQWRALEMVDGKSADVKSALPVGQASPDSLNLFDLGYFKQEHLRDIHAQGAFFVCRYQSQTDLYECGTLNNFALLDWLQGLNTNEGQCVVDLGSRVHVKVRLVARRLSPSSAAARRRKAIHKYKRDGKTCSKAYLSLLGWDLLVTNLFDTAWTIAHILALYPIRTQIEWLFRIWKSQLGIDHFGNWRRERVLCQLYAHLIGVLLCHRLCGSWLWVNEQEFSLSKCVHLIQVQLDALLRCIAQQWRGLTTWRRNLENSFQRFGLKTKRKKKPSTLQTLILEGLS